MDNMTSAFRHVLAQAGHADKNYVEESMQDGSVKVCGNPLNTTTFKTLVKNLRRNWRKFGPSTVRAHTLSVYTLKKMFDAVSDVARFANGIAPKGPAIIPRLQGIHGFTSSDSLGVQPSKKSKSKPTTESDSSSETGPGTEPEAATETGTRTASEAATEIEPTHPEPASDVDSEQAAQTELATTANPLRKTQGKAKPRRKRSVPKTIHLSYLRDYVAVRV